MNEQYRKELEEQIEWHDDQIEILEEQIEEHHAAAAELETKIESLGKSIKKLDRVFIGLSALMVALLTAAFASCVVSAGMSFLKILHGSHPYLHALNVLIMTGLFLINVSTAHDFYDTWKKYRS